MLDLGSLGLQRTGRTGGPVVGKCSSVVSPVGSCGRFCSFDVVACRKLVGSFSHSVLRPSSSPLSFLVFISLSFVVADARSRSSVTKHIPYRQYP